MISQSIVSGVVATMVGMAPKGHDLSTLSGRVSWVIETERVPSARAWSVGAELSPSYVGRLKREPKLKPTVEVLERLARVANVPLAWLRHGEGVPEGVDERWVEEDDPYPSRGDVLNSARQHGVDAQILEDIRREAFSDGDPGEEYWIKRLERRLETHARVGRAVERYLLPDDDTFGSHDDD